MFEYPLTQTEALEIVGLSVAGLVALMWVFRRSRFGDPEIDRDFGIFQNTLPGFLEDFDNATKGGDPRDK